MGAFLEEYLVYRIVQIQIKIKIKNQKCLLHGSAGQKLNRATKSELQSSLGHNLEYLSFTAKFLVFETSVFLKQKICVLQQISREVL